MDVQLLEVGARLRPKRPRAQDIDRHIGARLRQCRIMNGLTQQTLADLIGVTYQQAHKYEKGVNRIAAGRLYIIAQVLRVDVGYFFEGLQSDSSNEPTPQQRVFLDLARNFRSIQTPKHQEVICLLTRILAKLENTPNLIAWGPSLEMDESWPAGRPRPSIAATIDRNHCPPMRP
jgi:transcriptional regulator with XRE-family HTH domain